jgi:hypothetical protein
MTESVISPGAACLACGHADVRTVRAEPALVLFSSSGAHHTCAHLPGSPALGRSWRSPTRPAACARSEPAAWLGGNLDHRVQDQLGAVRDGQSWRRRGLHTGSTTIVIETEVAPATDSSPRNPNRR